MSLSTSVARRCARFSVCLALVGSSLLYSALASAGQAPVIVGTPPAAAAAGKLYSFQPQAYNSAHLPMWFFIYGKSPAWLKIDSSTGRIYGTPTAQDVGTYTNLSVAAYDALGNNSLPRFNITVTPGQVVTNNGVATVSWTPPTENADSSALTNLAGYRLYYGTQAGALTNSITVSNPGLAAYVIDNLPTGTWYFTMTAYNSQNVESDRTGVVEVAL